jgi:hypothetical protein
MHHEISTEVYDLQVRSKSAIKLTSCDLHMPIVLRPASHLLSDGGILILLAQGLFK